MRQAGRRPAIRARHAARVQEAQPADPLIARHMRMAVQEHVDILRRLVGRNVDQPKADAISLQIDDERPFVASVAISAHDRDGWPNGP